MKLQIWYEKEQREETISFEGKNIAQLLQYLKINPEVVLIVRNNEVLTSDQIVNNNDRIELLSVISGG